MERDFYRDEFEQLLKDSTDDFKMYPSRKVWHSIYNDLHPDRKWPSFAVCLLLLTAILYVGVSNNNSINSAARKQAAVLAMQMNTDGPVDNSVAAEKTGSSDEPRKERSISYSAASPLDVADVNLQLPTNLFQETASTSQLPSSDISKEDTEEELGMPAKNTFSGSDGRLSISISPAQPQSSINDKNSDQELKSLSTNIVKSDEDISVPNAENNREKSRLDLLNEIKTQRTTDTREKEWIEDHAFYNQPQKKKKFLAGYEGEFYITPGVGYRVMFQNSDYKKINNSLVAANGAARYAEPTPLELNQQIGLTMEMGGVISKKIGKRLTVKSGLQLNITDYITYAKKLDHPGSTMLALTNISNSIINFESRSTNYANVPGENTSQLHNKTIQVSMPLGADYKLLSAGRVNWHIGGSLQPGYNAGGYAYLVSADNNYFIEDQSMLRRWNVNGALESFVSIKTREGGRINLGPQFRYSLLSIYKNSYSYTEKPYSFGFKIGFSKSF